LRESIAACQARLITSPLIAREIEMHDAIRFSQARKIRHHVNCEIGRHAAAQDQQPFISDAKPFATIRSVVMSR
jgi:hypothetical protein